MHVGRDKRCTVVAGRRVGERRGTCGYGDVDGSCAEERCAGSGTHDERGGGTSMAFAVGLHGLRMNSKLSNPMVTDNVFV